MNRTGFLPVRHGKIFQHRMPAGQGGRERVFLPQIEHFGGAYSLHNAMMDGGPFLLIGNNISNIAA